MRAKRAYLEGPVPRHIYRMDIYEISNSDRCITPKPAKTKSQMDIYQISTVAIIKESIYVPVALFQMRITNRAHSLAQMQDVSEWVLQQPWCRR